MYCYIQEIQMKSSKSIGHGKELIVRTSSWTIDGVPYISYGYEYSDEKFERPIKSAYKVSIHDKSYRDEKGKVQKKQYYLATIKHYDLVDYSWCDCIINNMVDDIAEKIGIEPELLWNEIENKLDALQKKIITEFEQTEEYKVKTKHEQILKEYKSKKEDFAKKYEIRESEYDKCYDIYGVLRNPEYLKKIESDYQTRKAYERKSRSYQQQYNSNYNSYSGNSGMGFSSSETYSDKEKQYLKKFYRVLAAKYHPDVTGETETMQFLNKLKEKWGL